MRLLFILLSLFVASVLGKSNVKSLTESMGQEVIEIGTPIKDLPPDLEEEPSAEDDDRGTSTTLQPATKKDVKKTTAIETRKKGKDIDKIDGVKQEDDEARIEKELAELYKDNSDYKSDSAEVKDSLNKIDNNTDIDKPILRQRTNFKFQPDLSNKKEIERFRTSIDDISCGRRTTRRLHLPDDAKPGSASYIILNTVLLSFLISLPIFL